MRGKARLAAIACVTFAVMEAVSYATHRWLMHGPGLRWHASHHAPPTGRWEKNDRFPLVFSAVGVGLFAGAAAGTTRLWPVASGVTAYGAAYGFVHELAVHRRLAVPVPESPYLDWLRRAHAEHHRAGGEPYGMLLPVLRTALPSGAETDEIVPRPASVRMIRSRL